MNAYVSHDLLAAGSERIDAADIEEIELPALPLSIIKLSSLMGDDTAHQDEIACLVESDMLLAAAVLRAVNSARFALATPIRTVGQAVKYLGARDVTALTFEMALRSAFGDAAALSPIWDRAAKRGRLMARLALAMDLQAWPAHSAGLFEECGKAALYLHRPHHYPSMLKACSEDTELLQLERISLGVTHDQLGARLCSKWGLDPSVVASVRMHLAVFKSPNLLSIEASDVHVRHPLCLSVLARCFDLPTADLEHAIELVAEPAGIAPSVVRSAIQSVKSSQRDSFF